MEGEKNNRYGQRYSAWLERGGGDYVFRKEGPGGSLGDHTVLLTIGSVATHKCGRATHITYTLTVCGAHANRTRIVLCGRRKGGGERGHTWWNHTRLMAVALVSSGAAEKRNMADREMGSTSRRGSHTWGWKPQASCMCGNRLKESTKYPKICAVLTR